MGSGLPTRNEIGPDTPLRLGVAATSFARVKEAASIGGLDPNGSSFDSNAPKFGNRPKRTRVKEIWESAAFINELDVGWLLRKLKAKPDFNVCRSPNTTKRGWRSLHSWHTAAMACPDEPRQFVAGPGREK